MIGDVEVFDCEWTILIWRTCEQKQKYFHFSLGRRCFRGGFTRRSSYHIPFEYRRVIAFVACMHLLAINISRRLCIQRFGHGSHCWRGIRCGNDGCSGRNLSWCQFHSVFVQNPWNVILFIEISRFIIEMHSNVRSHATAKTQQKICWEMETFIYISRLCEWNFTVTYFLCNDKWSIGMPLRHHVFRCACVIRSRSHWSHHKSDIWIDFVWPDMAERCHDSFCICRIFLWQSEMGAEWVKMSI